MATLFIKHFSYTRQTHLHLHLQTQSACKCNEQLVFVTVSSERRWDVSPIQYHNSVLRHADGVLCVLSVGRASTLSNAVSSLASTGMSFTKVDEREKQAALETINGTSNIVFAVLAM